MQRPIFTIHTGSNESFHDALEHGFEEEDELQVGDDTLVVEHGHGGHDDSIMSDLGDVLSGGEGLTSPISPSGASTIKPGHVLPSPFFSGGHSPSHHSALETDVLPSSTSSPVASTSAEDQTEDTNPTMIHKQAEDEQEARLKANVRRYYALMELLETEKGYVADLRVLIEVSS